MLLTNEQNELIKNYSLLQDIEKREVLDFIRFLVGRKKQQTKPTKKEIENILLNISKWEDEDIEELAQARDRLNNWQIKEY